MTPTETRGKTRLPLQSAYKQHIEVNDAVYMLHHVLAHLEESGTFMRVHFSNAFNTIQPNILKDKLTEMGTDSSFVF